MNPPQLKSDCCPDCGHPISEHQQAFYHGQLECAVGMCHCAKSQEELSKECTPVPGELSKLVAEVNAPYTQDSLDKPRPTHPIEIGKEWSWAEPALPSAPDELEKAIDYVDACLVESPKRLLLCFKDITDAARLSLQQQSTIETLKKERDAYKAVAQMVVDKVESGRMFSKETYKLAKEAITTSINAEKEAK